MRILQREIVTRYMVSFTPGETKKLAAHPVWQHHIGRVGRGDKSSQATLSRKEINAVCDVLGVNGREFMATQLAKQIPGNGQ